MTIQQDWATVEQLAKPGYTDSQSAVKMRGASGPCLETIRGEHKTIGIELAPERRAWRCFVRLLVPSPSGGKRFDVSGALDAVNKEVLAIINGTCFNAESAWSLLTQTAKRYVETRT